MSCRIKLAKQQPLNIYFTFVCCRGSLKAPWGTLRLIHFGNAAKQNPGAQRGFIKRRQVPPGEMSPALLDPCRCLPAGSGSRAAREKEKQLGWSERVQGTSNARRRSRGAAEGIDLSQKSREGGDGGCYLRVLSEKKKKWGFGPDMRKKLLP